MKKEDKLISEVFDLVKDYEGDTTSVLDEVARKVEIYQKEISEGLRKKNADRIKEVADEIFKLCPICNFIPVSIETSHYDDYITEVELDRLWDACEYYLCDEEDNDYELIMPHQYDDMTFGNWKRVNELWEELIKLCGYKYSISHDGDYCEDYHLSVNGFSKKKKKIESYYDING